MNIIGSGLLGLNLVDDFKGRSQKVLLLTGHQVAEQKTMECLGAEVLLRCHRKCHVHTGPCWSAAAPYGLVEVGEGLRLIQQEHETLLEEVDSYCPLDGGDDDPWSTYHALHAVVHRDDVVGADLTVEVEDELSLLLALNWRFGAPLEQRI